LPRGCYFCLDTKVTKKSSHQECFFAARGLRRANQEKPCAAIFLPHCVRAKATASVKSCYALPRRTALPVFPGFTRSCPADGEASPFLCDLSLVVKRNAFQRLDRLVSALPNIRNNTDIEPVSSLKARPAQ